MNYSDLLTDLQLLIDSLNDTINFIKTDPPKKGRRNMFTLRRGHAKPYTRMSAQRRI